MEDNLELNGLYEIRTVLSVMSKQADGVLEKEQEISILDNKKQTADLSNVKRKNYVKDAKDDAKRLKETLVEKEKSLEEAKKSLTRDDGKVKKNLMKSIIHLVIAAVFIFAFIMLYNAQKEKDEGGSVAFLFFAIPFAILAIVRFVNFCEVVGWVKGDKIRIETTKAEIKQIELEIIKENSNYDEKQRELSEKQSKADEEYKNRVQEIRNKVKMRNADLNNKIKEIKKEQREIIRASKVLYETSLKKYSEILDERDWENVDLLIYFIETKRAANIKEALLQVDNYRYAGSIVGAIKDMSSRICDSIDRNARIIADRLNKGFINTSLRLESIEKGVMIGNQETSNLLRDLTSQVNLQNALQKKANETSESLMNDINYIKTREEYRQMKY